MKTGEEFIEYILSISPLKNTVKIKKKIYLKISKKRRRLVNETTLINTEIINVDFKEKEFTIFSEYLDWGLQQSERKITEKVYDKAQFIDFVNKRIEIYNITFEDLNITAKKYIN